ncbi:MAG: fused MFS/spermidine synthase [Actinobacteria bacterium]|nr:fused MFS/spermidine synthase [Actinomycetota bacterium]
MLSFLVFVVGAAGLGTEIAAARLLAPFFGASTIVWANTIGVVLVALAVGYWLGGRFADRHPHLRGLCLLVISAAVFLALVPLAARPFLRFAVDALGSIDAGAFVGSLFAVLVLTAIPLILLGAATPYALRLAISDLERAGEVAGRLYAISTAGSLLGTMLAALVLIPFVGTQRTFLLFALALALVAVLGLGWRYLAVPAILMPLALLAVGAAKGAGEGKVVFEDETPYQYVRVLERDGGERILELNEGQAIHSLYRPGQFLTGDYWDGFLVLPFAAGAGLPRHVLMLGSAAGTVARSYGHFFPRTRFDSVEIDGELTSLGRRYFGLRNPRMRTYTADARPFLEQSSERYDAIMVDAYRQPYIPFYLVTREFFELARDHLTPAGTVVVNVGHPEGSDDLERVLGRTMADVFPSVARAPLEPTNTLLVGARRAPTSRLLLGARASLPEALRPLAVRVAGALAPRLPGGEVYTDDRAPVEWLVDKSLLGYANAQ